MNAADPRWVVIEFLKNAPDGINKAKMYKAFYLAHLLYADQAPGLLTNWEIEHTPQGPGISDSFRLFDSLEAGGYLSRSVAANGLYKEHLYRWTGKAVPAELPKDAAEAVKRATEYVLPLTATQLRDLTHEHSRSWVEGCKGEKLEIYTDLVDDEEYDRRNASLERLEEQLKAAKLEAPACPG